MAVGPGGTELQSTPITTETVEKLARELKALEHVECSSIPQKYRESL